MGRSRHAARLPRARTRSEGSRIHARSTARTSTRCTQTACQTCTAKWQAVPRPAAQRSEGSFVAFRGRRAVANIVCLSAGTRMRRCTCCRGAARVARGRGAVVRPASRGAGPRASAPPSLAAALARGEAEARAARGDPRRRHKHSRGTSNTKVKLSTCCATANVNPFASAFELP